MGNHEIGRGLAAGARGFWAAWTIGRKDGDNPTKAQAIAALDAIVGPKEESDYRNCRDAEFNEEFDAENPLCRLVEIAFEATPAEIASRDIAEDDGDAWYEGPETRFRNRYGFGC
jgi:hypothetical protein